MSKFKEGVIKVVNLIPYGMVASYGQVAAYVGMPRAARQVGWMLNKLPDNTVVPWWRVVNNKGRISIIGSKYSAKDQRLLLEKEGVEILDDLSFDIEKYRFKPDKKFIRKLELDPTYLEMIGNKISFC